MNSACYQRPHKPLCTSRRALDLADLEAGGAAPSRPFRPPVTVPAHLECHVTPPDVAARMAARLPDRDALDVLEPSAGTGAILRAIREARPLARVQAVEVFRPLWERLTEEGHAATWADFDEWATETPLRFDAVVMNPPFRRARAHVAAAKRLLRPGGLLIALVPVTFPLGFELERLGPDTFAAARVVTKIVEL